MQSRRRPALASCALLLVWSVALGACSDASEVPPQTSSPSVAGPFGTYPARGPGDGANEALLEGRLELVDGCLVLSEPGGARYALLLPDDVMWTGDAVETDDETRWVVGESVRIGGAERSRTAGLAGGMPESCPDVVWEVQ